jgi:protein-S-isoprenylcysteine O-methyltransferase Ste14
MTEHQIVARGARVIFIPPPLYYVAGLVGGALLDRVVPLGLPGAGPGLTIVGIAVALAGLLFTGTAVVAVIRHRTTIVPHHTVNALIMTGPYQWSRNPMYTGLAAVYLGIALVVGSWWPIVFWPAVLLVVAVLVIRPEEQYLTQRFGDSYRRYQSSVRRWL